MLASHALYYAYLGRLLTVSQKELSRQATTGALLHFDEIVSKVDFKQYVLTMDTPHRSKTNKLEAKGDPSWKPKGTNVNKTDLFFPVFDRRCRSLFHSTVAGYSDHNQGIMDLKEFDFFVACTSEIFPVTFDILALLNY